MRTLKIKGKTVLDFQKSENQETTVHHTVIPRFCRLFFCFMPVWHPVTNLWEVSSSVYQQLVFFCRIDPGQLISLVVEVMIVEKSRVPGIQQSLKDEMSRACPVLAIVREEVSTRMSPVPWDNKALQVSRDARTPT